MVNSLHNKLIINKPTRKQMIEFNDLFVLGDFDSLKKWHE